MISLISSRFSRHTSVMVSVVALMSSASAQSSSTAASKMPVTSLISVPASTRLTSAATTMVLTVEGAKAAGGAAVSVAVESTAGRSWRRR